jgi:uncharacterized membrane protein
MNAMQGSDRMQSKDPKPRGAESSEIPLPMPARDERRTPFMRFWMAMRGLADVVAALFLVIAAAVAFLTLPAGSWLRIALALPAVLIVPGFLLLRSFNLTSQARGGTRWWDVGLALGVSPAMVGLIALSTAVVPGEFRAGPIVVAVLAACALLAVVAGVRSTLLGSRRPVPEPALDNERRR